MTAKDFHLGSQNFPPKHLKIHLRFCSHMWLKVFFPEECMSNHLASFVQLILYMPFPVSLPPQHGWPWTWMTLGWHRWDRDCNTYFVSENASIYDHNENNLHLKVQVLWNNSYCAFPLQRFLCSFSSSQTRGKNEKTCWKWFIENEATLIHANDYYEYLTINMSHEWEGR